MVPDRRGLCAVAVEQFLEPRIPEAATGHLDRLAGLLHTCRHVEVAYIYVYSELFRYIRGMAHVAHRLLSAQVEVTVRRAAVIAQARQYGQQRHRVGTAAQGHYHRGRFVQQPPGGYIVRNPGFEIRHAVNNEGVSK